MPYLKARALTLLLTMMPVALPQAAEVTRSAILKFSTTCARCHEGECSGRLSFSSGLEATTGHIRRYLPALRDEAELAAMFELLRHTKEQCRHYPISAEMPTDGHWQVEQLKRWRDNDSGNYFIPLGTLMPGEYRLRLQFASASRAELRVDRWDFMTVLEELPCNSERIDTSLRIESPGLYYLHLTTTTALHELVVTP